ncbi:hypothetical protein [Faecalispora jeddahensis]|nr:hypothetical protein [Faecalispora jeddahensis]
MNRTSGQLGPKLPGSVPMLEYAAGMGQERLSGETAKDNENGGYP